MNMYLHSSRKVLVCVCFLEGLMCVKHCSKYWAYGNERHTHIFMKYTLLQAQAANDETFHHLCYVKKMCG